MTSVDPILSRFRATLADVYGDRIERVVLYGSRVRGGSEPDSDFDVALFLENFVDTWQEVRRLVDIQLAIRDETGAEIHTLPFPSGRWCDAGSPLMYEIRQDGVDL